MLNSINSKNSLNHASLPKEAQLIPPKINLACQLKSIHNSNVKILRPKTPLYELHTCQKLNPLIDKASIKQHYHDALLADFVYSRDLTSLEATQWGVDRELTRFLFKETKKKPYSEHGLFKDIKMSEIEQHPDLGLLRDRSTGLVTYIFYNKAEQKIRLVFGGTTSGLGVTGGAPRFIKNNLTFITQCGANINNIFGNIPDCYKQAAQLMHNLQQLVKADNEWIKCDLSTSGHSLGGGLAAYAALKVSSKENVILAECFSSAQLGRGLQDDLLKQYGSLANLKKVNNNINHYYVDGDLIPKMDKFFAVDHIGSVNIIPQIAEKKDGALAAHARYVDHLRALYQQAV